MPFFRYTSSLESCHQVIGQANNFQIQGIGRKGTGRHLPQGVVLPQLPDASLQGGTVIIEMPDARRGEREIGDPGAIGIAAYEKKSRLRFLQLQESS